MSNRIRHAILLIADKWEAIYVNGRLVEQGPPLRADWAEEYFQSVATKHGFDIQNMGRVKVDPKDVDLVNQQYVFPPDIKMLFGTYR